MKKTPEVTGHDTVLQFRLDLVRARPPIWRRLLVTADSTLETLHGVIQTSMGWGDEHLHEFAIRGGRFGMIMPSEGDFGMEPPVDEAKVRLVELVLTKGTRFEYVYDFGDNWVHQLELEDILERDPAGEYPICTKAVGAGPLEDVGGIWGYHNMIEALADPDHEDHGRYAEWFDDPAEWDPAHVDLADINKRLAWFA